jgi:hypothetical protein
MIKNLKVKCRTCGYKNRIPFNEFIVKQTASEFKVYIPRYSLEVVKCKKCGKVIGEPTIEVFKETVIKMILLERLFSDFCSYQDGKLSWSETKDKEWTDLVLKFFNEMNNAETIPYVEEYNYMDVDYIWRFNPDRYSVYDIELAVEHEGQVKDVDTLSKEEIQHLIDIKAKNKVGIFYPSLGDEKEFVEKIKHKIVSQSPPFQTPNEMYLIMLGYAVRRKGIKAILFKGFIFNQKGDLEKQMEQTILQKTIENIN